MKVLLLLPVFAMVYSAPQDLVSEVGQLQRLEHEQIKGVYEVIPYSYQYEVQDVESGNFQNKAEMKTDNGDVFGSYSVLMPDGYIYTTTYNVTGENGYRASLVKTLADVPEPRDITPHNPESRDYNINENYSDEKRQEEEKEEQS